MDYNDYAANTSTYLSSSPSSFSSSPSCSSTMKAIDGQQQTCLYHKVQSSTFPALSKTPLQPSDTPLLDTCSSAVTDMSHSPTSIAPAGVVVEDGQAHTSEAMDHSTTHTVMADDSDLWSSTDFQTQDAPNSVALLTDSTYWCPSTMLIDDGLPRLGSTGVDVNHSERGIAGFVSKLYQSLQAPDNEHKYARWCKHNGKDMFVIECIPKIVLPKLFKHCKFASFVRQLNIYGFRRDTDARKSKDTKDKESCRWHHPYFRPGRRDLFHKIRRKATRYPRQRRHVVSDSRSTILHLGSADESDVEEQQLIRVHGADRPRSPSASSMAVSMLQQDKYGIHTQAQAQTQHVLPSPLTPGEPSLRLSTSQPSQIPPSQPTLKTHAQPPFAAIYESPPQPELQPDAASTTQHYTSMSMAMMPQVQHFHMSTPTDHDKLIPDWTVSTPRDTHKPEIYPHGRPSVDMVDHQQDALDDQSLQAQLLQLKCDHQRMSKELTAKIKEAYALIESQECHIRALEQAANAKNAAFRMQDQMVAMPPSYMTPSMDYVNHGLTQHAQRHHGGHTENNRCHDKGDAYAPLHEGMPIKMSPTLHQRPHAEDMNSQPYPPNNTGEPNHQGTAASESFRLLFPQPLDKFTSNDFVVKLKMHQDTGCLSASATTGASTGGEQHNGWTPVFTPGMEYRGGPSTTSSSSGLAASTLAAAAAVSAARVDPESPAFGLSGPKYPSHCDG